MKYVCLVYHEESTLDAMSKHESDDYTRQNMTNDEDLRQRGHLIIAQALQSVRTAVTVRVRNNRLSTTDGPFAETREQLGGLVMIEARDLNEAIQIAATMPPARVGCIEVRPALELEWPT
jgi:hypothetical protein